PEVMRAHGGAFDMPAGTTFAPWALPGRFSGLGCLPEREVERVFFFLARRDAGADEQVIDVPVRQLAVPGERPYPEVHVALGLVGVALVNQTLDHLDDLGDLLRRTWIDVGRKDVERGHLVRPGVHQRIR